MWPSSLSGAEQMEFQPCYAWVILWTIQNLPSKLSPPSFLPHSCNIWGCSGHFSVQLTMFWGRVGDRVLVLCYWLAFLIRLLKFLLFCFRLKTKKESCSMAFVGKCLYQALAPEMQWLFFLFWFVLPSTESRQNTVTAFLWFSASPLHSTSEGHGGPMAARQKPPAPPVSWLLWQGDEREDKVIMGKVRINMVRKLPPLPRGTRAEEDDGWKALNKVLVCYIKTGRGRDLLFEL